MEVPGVLRAYPSLDELWHRRSSRKARGPQLGPR
jgi:hypothetical protein